MIWLYNTIRPDFKKCWFTVTLPGLQGTCWSKNFFDAHSLKIFFSHIYIILAMLSYTQLGEKSKLLTLSSASFLVVVLTFLPTVLYAGFTRLRYNRPSNKSMEG